MRVFVALVLDDSFKSHLIAATAGLCAERSELRWIPAANLHLTLAFLGELDERGVDLADEAAELAAARSGPFNLSSTALVALPRRSRCRVLAAKAERGEAEATELAGAFERALAELGREAGYPFRPVEDRPFTPHITLARSHRSPVAFAERELSLRDRVSAEIIDLAVYRSILGAGGARYDELARFRLGGGRLP